jgi:hypothetical protein
VTACKAVSSARCISTGRGISIYGRCLGCGCPTAVGSFRPFEVARWRSASAPVSTRHWRKTDRCGRLFSGRVPGQVRISH